MEDVTRYYVYDEFNPSSSKQLLAYMRAKGITPEYSAKTGNETTDKAALERLAKRDPFFKKILQWRDISKIKGTYVEPYLSKADEDARIHGQFLHGPSTMRLSSKNPNLQNVPDEEDESALARKFRHCIVATPGSVLVSCDFAAIEAVLTGYFMQDPVYIRLATKGIHSYVLSHLLGCPPDLNWPDDKLAGYLQEIKAKHKKTHEYEGCKRGVHLTNYGGSPSMMVMANPEVFSFELARKIQTLYLNLCPKLSEWQNNLRVRAAKEHKLGGRDHPFNYVHWFWDVQSWDAIRKKFRPGSDWNRVVSFYPQSTAAGVLFETCLALVDPHGPYYVGDMYDGKTPLRALIHDEILSEVPANVLDTYVERVEACMTRPIPQLGGLQLGTDIKIGRDWGSMKPYKEVR